MAKRRATKGGKTWAFIAISLFQRGDEHSTIFECDTRVEALAKYKEVRTIAEGTIGALEKTTRYYIARRKR